MEKPVLLRRRGPLNFERELDAEDVDRAREYAQNLPDDQLENKLFEVCAAHQKAKIYTAIACALPWVFVLGSMPFIDPYIVAYPIIFMIFTPLVLCGIPFLGLSVGLRSRRRIVTVLLAIRYRREGACLYYGT